MHGKVILFEGIDGSGKDSQIRLVKKYLEKKGVKTTVFLYPKKKSVGKLIREKLKNGETNPNVLISLFFADFEEDVEKIKDLKRQGYVVILNRYYLSTFAYQSAQGFKIEKLIELKNIFEFPKIDGVILLDIDVETSLKRTGKKDYFEKDKQFLEKVRRRYKKFVKMFEKYVVIDGKKNKKDVFEEVKNFIETLL